MRVTAVQLWAGNTHRATFSLNDPVGQGSYLLNGFTGLDSDDIRGAFYAHDTNGVPYYDLGMAKRTVVLRAALNPNYGGGETPEQLRAHLQRAIAASRSGVLTLRFMADKACRAYISGMVTKFESGLFNKLPEIQITLECDDAWLYSPDMVELDVHQLDLETTLKDPISTAPHGATFKVSFDEAAFGFRITDQEVKFEVTPGTIGGDTGFILNDELTIVSGANPSVSLLRSDVTYQLANAIVAGSHWPILFPNDNDFVFCAMPDATSLVSNNFTWVELSYRHTYWGV